MILLIKLKIPLSCWFPQSHHGPSLEADFNAFLKKNLETFEAVFKVIKEMDQLLETSFGVRKLRK